MIPLEAGNRLPQSEGRLHKNMHNIFFDAKQSVLLAGLLCLVGSMLFGTPAVHASSAPAQSQWMASESVSYLLAAKGEEKPSRKPQLKPRRSKAAVQRSEAPAPSAMQRHLTLAIFANIIIGVIYGFWARLKKEHSAPPVYAAIAAAGDNPYGYGQAMKAVKLKKNQGIDPHTIRDADESLIQPIGKFRAVGPMPATRSINMDPDQEDITEADTVAFGTEDGSKQQFPAPPPIDEPSEPLLTSSAFKIKSLKNASEMIQKSPSRNQRAPSPGALFPPEISMHYQPKAGEKLALTCDFKVPLHAQGLLVITNKRLIAVYQRHNFTLLPPQITVENRRNSVRLRQIEEVSIIGSNRPLLLAIGAAAAWIPTGGVVLAGLCVAGFFFWTRPDLAIRMENQLLRCYPLRPDDLGRAQHLIDSAQAQLATRPKVPLGGPSRAS